MPARPQSTRARWLLAALGVVLALAASELVARRLVQNNRTRVYRFDEERIYAPVPDTSKVFVRPRVGADPLPIRLALNSLGLRGPEPDRASDAPRVVVYGDSYVEARYVPEDESYTSRLQAALTGLRERPIEVWNAGVTGYGPDQSYLRMAAELPVLQPDAVVFVIFAGNDFGDLLRNKLFRLDERGALVRNAPVLTDELRGSFAPPGGLALPALVRGTRGAALAIGEAPTSASVQRVLDRALASGAEEYDEYVVRRDDVVRHPFRDRYDADLSLSPDGPAARYKLALMEAVLAAVAEEARARSTPLLFVFVPHLLDACPQDVQVDLDRYPAYRPDAKTRALVEIAGRLGVPCVDLFPAFREACDRELYFRIVDDHWNANGQALAAEETAAVLVETGLIP